MESLIPPNTYLSSIGAYYYFYITFAFGVGDSITVFSSTQSLRLKLITSFSNINIVDARIFPKLLSKNSANALLSLLSLQSEVPFEDQLNPESNFEKMGRTRQISGSVPEEDPVHCPRSYGIENRRG